MKQITKIVHFLFFAILALANVAISQNKVDSAVYRLLGSCNSNYILYSPSFKNPTTYIFNANIDEIKNIISSNFSKYNFNGMILRTLDNNNTFSEAIFNNPNNKNDAYLYSHDLINSSIYYKDSKPLLYSVSFHIHLDSIDKNHTSVQVNSMHPEVIVGTKFGFSDNMKLRTADFRKVEPSTVEEYQILLIIGNSLKDRNMPTLIMPEKQTIKRK